MFDGSLIYGPIKEVVDPLSRFSKQVMRGISFDAAPALNRNPPEGKNTEIPYVKPAIKDEWLFREKRPKLKNMRKQEEEQTLLREKKKLSFKKIFLKFRKGNL